MKKIIFLLLLSLTLFSQNQLPSTTYDEYNYMTKGYRIQVESGLDTKKGYTIKDITFYDAGNYTFNYKSLIRENNSIAGIILIANSKIWNKEYYLAIPVNNKQMNDLFNLSLEIWDEPMITAYSQSVSFLMSQMYFSMNIKQ